jgi:hypothetical protein
MFNLAALCDDPKRIEARRQELLVKQEALAVREQQEAATLHRTRSALDRIAGALDQVDYQAALTEELRRMQSRPQDPVSAHSGLTREQVEALRGAYTASLADRIERASAQVGRRIDADVPSLEQLAQGAAEQRDLDARVATPARMAAAMLKLHKLTR